MLLAQTLREEFSNASILLVTGSPVIHSFRIPDRVDYIKLPCQDRVAADVYAPLYLGQHGAVVDNTTLVHAPHLLLAQPLNRQTQLHLEQGFVSQRYGVKQCAPVVRFQRHAADTIFHTVLYPFAQRAPQIKVEQLPGQTSTYQADTRLMTSLRVTITTAAESYVDTFRLVQNQHQITHAYEYARQQIEPLTAANRPCLAATYGQVGRINATILPRGRAQ